MRTLVTGASGFVGRHLVAHLAACGDDVTVVDRTGAEPVDLTDPGALLRAVDAARPEAVYHLAARSHVGLSWADGDLLERVNVGGTRTVLDACARVGVGRVLVVGSAEQYGAVDPELCPLSEDTPMHPLSPYGASKLAAEQAALDAFHEHGLAVVCVRAFNHAGPGQSPAFLLPGLAARVARAERDGDAEIAVGNLDSVRDFSDVRDVVRAYRLLVEHGEPGEPYNVCSGVPERVRDLADRLLALATRPVVLRVDPDLVRPVEVPVLVGDPAKVVATTGWRREIELGRTLADVLDEARAGV